MSNQLSGRYEYFDYLRVFATFAVIVLHVSSQNWSSSDIHGIDWQIFNIADSLVRWSVPAFVMISGSLFLNRDIPLKRIYSKYILRMAVAFLFWSVFYMLFFGKGSVGHRILIVIQGHYHMWFILMIIGLYMCIPIIKRLIKDESVMKYYLLLSFIFAYVIPELIRLITDFGNQQMVNRAAAIREVLKDFNIYLVLGYVSYFILGYFINKTELNKKQRMVIYLLGLVGFVFTIGITIAASFKAGAPVNGYYKYITVNVLLEAIAVFTWFKYRNYRHPKLNMLFKKMAKYSFGAYLIHDFFIKEINIRLGLNTVSYPSVFAVICNSLIVFILSFAVSALLNQIPIVKKYIV